MAMPPRLIYISLLVKIYLTQHILLVFFTYEIVRKILKFFKKWNTIKIPQPFFINQVQFTFSKIFTDWLYKINWKYN